MMTKARDHRRGASTERKPTPPSADLTVPVLDLDEVPHLCHWPSRCSFYSPVS